MTALPPEPVLEQLLDSAEIGVCIIGADLRYQYVNARMAAINGVPREAHLGRTVAETLPPEIAAPVQELIERVLATGEPSFSSAVAGSTPGASDRHWEASHLPLDTPGGPAVAAMVVDVTERTVATENARRRVAQQMLVADLGQRALRETAIEDLLDLACLRIRDALDGDFTGVMFLEDEHLVMRAGAGWPPSAMGRIRAELGTASQAGYSLMAGEPVVLRDVTTEHRFALSDALLELGVCSAISTPIPGESGPVGVLGVLSRRTAQFDDDDAAFMRGVAHVLGSALVNDQQRGRLEELAAQRGRLIAQALDAGEQEQRRVASVLHDEVLQQLLSARLELSSAVDGDGHVALGRARAAVTEAAETVRSLITSIHPVTLSHAGLAPTLHEIAAVHAGRSGIDVGVEVDDTAEGIADRLLVSLVRELLDNVARHADARRAEIYAGVDEGHLVLRVSDDGRGLQAPAEELATDNRLGLAYARERVEALGGTLDAGNGPLGGTTVVVLLPARRPAD